jgi:thiol-disulfide isomerase/thioredoxin
MKPGLIFGCALALILTQATLAAELGDPAPPLKISEWVKGKPVDLAAVKGKQVVVVEFWATWCPPCRTSIPHLTEMQKKFPDVAFVGVTDEESPIVKKFVTKMGDQMDYVVAVDADKKTSAGYMEAFGQGGIPHAFIVDKAGRIVWHGHPMEGLDVAVAEVLAGKLDLNQAKQREVARQKLEAFYQAAQEGRDEAQIEKLGRELEALDLEIGGVNPGQKFSAAEARKSVKFQGLLHDYQLAVMAGKGGTNLARIEKLLADFAPAEFNLAEFKDVMAMNTLFGAYYRAATGQGAADQLPELTKQLGEVKTKNGALLNEWAWTILTDPHLKTRDLALATKLAQTAVEATEAKETALLDTYARALFDSGKVAEAIEWEKKAVGMATDEEMKKVLGETLKKYEAKLGPN